MKNEKQPQFFRIIDDGDECVIEFNPILTGTSVPAANLRSELKEFIDANNCRKLTIDCSASVYLTGGTLGILASFHGKGPEIHLINASTHVVSLMKASRLDERIRVSEASATDPH